MRNITTTLFILLVYSLCAVPAFAAEDVRLAPFNDVTPPKIEHEPINHTQEAGAPLTIYATVTDTAGVKDVTLFYRTGSMTEYRPLTMYLSDQNGNRFTATIPPVELQSPKLEYYIQATDINGNTVLRAGRLFPLSVAIAPPNTAPVQPEEPAQPKAKKSKYTWAWILGGVVIAGLAAAASNSGGGDGGTTNSDTGSIEVVGPAP